MDLLLKNILRSVIKTHIPEAIQKGDKWNFRCNVCGDSKKKKSKKRGWILEFENFWHFKCFNCNISMSASNWLKKYYPEYYKSYINQYFQLNNIQSKEEVKEVKKEVKENFEKKEVKEFQKILDGKDELFSKAIELCILRQIPTDIWKKWYVAVNGFYKNRLIIPFYDDKDKIYYWQGRDLVGNDPKYLNRLMNRNGAIYNFYNIDRKLPVVILEGVIDSLFIDNSIAVVGSQWNEEVSKKLAELDCYYLLDDDETGSDKSKKLLFEGKKVFVWNKFRKDLGLFKKDKWDINEVVIEKKISHFSFKDLECYFTKNLYDGIYFSW